MVLSVIISCPQLENSGDPFEFTNPQQLSYWTCVYFLIVTMSTVGYGDVYCQTVLGRTFLVFFLLVGLVSYSSRIIYVATLINLRRLHKGRPTRVRYVPQEVRFREKCVLILRIVNGWLRYPGPINPWKEAVALF